MPDYDDRRGDIITDLPELETLLDDLKVAVSFCKNDIDRIHVGGEGTDIRVDEVFIIGSWARGTAIIGESDLDLLISFKNPDGDDFDPRFDLTKSAVSGCLQELEERILKKGPQRDSIDGIDVITTVPENKWRMAAKFTHETRDDRPDGKPQVYHLNSMEFMDIRTLEQTIDFTERQRDKLDDEFG